MGSVFNRGTRDKPNFYVKFRDLDGKWKMRPAKGAATKSEARKVLYAIESRVTARKVGIETPEAEPLCAVLFDKWESGLTNRSAADDRSRLRKHVKPAFGDLRPSEVNLRRVMDWIDRQRAAGKLADATIRHNLNVLSRFFSWGIERGHATVNPVRQIPIGKRPRQSQKRDVPWLDDDAVVRKLFHALRSPVDLMFYLGNRSGLRTGEIAGLRLSDLDFLHEGVIRVRFSYEGPLKEDKNGDGKVKWVPAAVDAEDMLGSAVATRRGQGAGPEDLVFPCPTRGGRPYRKELIESRWADAAKAVGVSLTWYQATRHSFVSRNLARGASLDEVSAAVGHSNPVVTRRYYDHFVRRNFCDELRAGLSVGERAGSIAPVVALAGRSRT